MEETLFWVPQESILRPLLFNIFSCDLSLIMNDVEFTIYNDKSSSFEDLLEKDNSSLYTMEIYKH